MGRLEAIVKFNTLRSLSRVCNEKEMHTNARYYSTDMTHLLRKFGFFFVFELLNKRLSSTPEEEVNFIYFN